MQAKNPDKVLSRKESVGREKSRMKRREVEESWEEEDDEEEESFGATPEIANFARFPVDGQEDKQNTAQLMTVGAE